MVLILLEILKEEMLFSGKVDAVIADGFTGNIFLKTVEGMGKFIKKSLSESLKRISYQFSDLFLPFQLLEDLRK